MTRGPSPWRAGSPDKLRRIAERVAAAEPETAEDRDAGLLGRLLGF